MISRRRKLKSTYNRPNKGVDYRDGKTTQAVALQPDRETGRGASQRGHRGRYLPIHISDLTHREARCPGRWSVTENTDAPRGEYNTRYNHREQRKP